MRFIVVHRKKETLALYKHRFLRGWLMEKSYRCAVGRVGLETPAGMREVQDKSRHPSYQYPQSDWVPAELRGVLIPFGDPRNPIAARWIGLGDDGIGIHGTFDDASIGHAESHGCVRLHADDVIDIFDRVRRGTPVFIF